MTQVELDVSGLHIPVLSIVLIVLPKGSSGGSCNRRRLPASTSPACEHVGRISANSRSYGHENEPDDSDVQIALSSTKLACDFARATVGTRSHREQAPFGVTIRDRAEANADDDAIESHARLDESL
jgi:hypothetical protein